MYTINDFIYSDCLDYNENENVWFVDTPLEYVKTYFGAIPYLEDDFTCGELRIYTDINDEKVLRAEVGPCTMDESPWNWCFVDIKEAEAIFEKVKADSRV